MRVDLIRRMAATRRLAILLSFVQLSGCNTPSRPAISALPPPPNGTTASAAADQWRGRHAECASRAAGVLWRPAGKLGTGPGRGAGARRHHAGLRRHRYTRGRGADSRQHPEGELHHRSGCAWQRHTAYGAAAEPVRIAADACRSLLSQNGAALVANGGLYRVVPIAQVAASAATGADTAGAVIVPLHYASADALEKVLQPYVGSAWRDRCRSSPQRAADFRRSEVARQPAGPGAGIRHRRPGRTVLCRAASDERRREGLRRLRCRTRSAARTAVRWPACCAWYRCRG